jgi:hypothetical protein
MTVPVSISLNDLTAVVKGSVAQALERNQAILPPNHIFGFIPPYWWLGIVVRNADGKLTLTAVEQVATDVHKAVSKSVPALQSVPTGIIFVGGHVTIGFAPPPDVILTEE